MTSSDDLHSGKAQGLLRFLDYAGEKGLLNPKTAAARKSACTKVLEIDGPKWREQSVAELDVDSQLERFSRKSGGKYSPGSLATYGQRFRDSVREYAEYLANPTGYRGQKPKARRKAASSPRPTARREPSRTEGAEPVVPDAGLITYPFPLGGGALGYLQLPREITDEDAERLSRFIRSLAIDTGPGTEDATGS